MTDTLRYFGIKYVTDLFDRYLFTDAEEEEKKAAEERERKLAERKRADEERKLRESQIPLAVWYGERCVRVLPKRDDSDAGVPEQHACLPCMSPGGLRFLATHAPPVSVDGSPLATTPAARRAGGDTERKLPPPSFRLPDSLVAGP